LKPGNRGENRELCIPACPTGNIGTYEYDAAGRQTRESYNGSVEAEYFYDQYPGDAVLGLADNFEWEGYPAYGVTIGRMVARAEAVYGVSAC
jgi:hypothetical protein